MNTSHFRICANDNGTYFWQLVSGNGITVSRSETDYKRRSDAEKGANAISSIFLDGKAFLKVLHSYPE